MNQNKTNLAKKEMTALNEKAKIEFIDAFSDMKRTDLINPNTNASSDAVAPVADIKAGAAKPVDSAMQKTSKSNASTSSIDKGLSGL